MNISLLRFSRKHVSNLCTWHRMDLFRCTVCPTHAVLKLSLDGGRWPGLTLLLLLLSLISPVLSQSTAIAIDYWQTFPCPQLCSIAGPNPSQWRYYHDKNALRRCNEITIFQMNLYNAVADPKTHALYRACTASRTEMSSRSPVEKRQFLAFDWGTPIEV